MITLPPPTGPYQVGLAIHELPHERPIPLHLYFPMQKGPHLPCDKVFTPRAPKVWPPLETKVFAHVADLSSLREGSHPLVMMHHGDEVAMTDYATINEELASHGYVVVAMQYQLDSDPPREDRRRSLAPYATVIDTTLSVFEWLQASRKTLFQGRLDTSTVGLIGHSMGASALLLHANRAAGAFRSRHTITTLLPHQHPDQARECIIALDTAVFPPPHPYGCPIRLLFSEEVMVHQQHSGADRALERLGHMTRSYTGSTHLSFMDHGYVDDQPLYFKGSNTERKAFFDALRWDIRRAASGKFYVGQRFLEAADGRLGQMGMSWPKADVL